MKKRIASLTYLGVFIMALNFIACQDGFEEAVDGNVQQSITANSHIGMLIKRTAAKDGSFDNIVDGASCISVQFPYNVEANGVQLTINSRKDFGAIESIFDRNDAETNNLEIVFPITIVLANYDEEIIDSKEQLQELAASCIEGGNDDNIECVDFIYPITIFTFDPNNQRTGEVNVSSDRQLRIFFKGLNDTDLVGVEFPLTLQKFDTTEIIINTNSELVATLETAKDECDEDDDNDFNDDDFDEQQFDAYLGLCEWEITEMVSEGNSQIEQYVGYTLAFLEENILLLKDMNGNTFNGTWSSNFTTQGALVTIQLEEFIEFNLEWSVSEIAQNTIRFNVGTEHKIILEQRCVDEASALIR
ncbi:hypothetical protein LV716_12035 [Flagellimonas sp. HMM57]|uniref:hypothetical protein n=1 Tax=unclassified Flagellimonas TaxID=2644544 RepID=UPI0013D1EF80|nr:MULTISPECIES: hypothetical protein [unclassified Flagellimonas]UII74987.1 hypothetical protein LV716_12035 [Flagellimonas sp. HMM57]